MADGSRGYVGRILRVDLSTGRLSDETIEPEVMRKFVGGTGLGAKILYDEVAPGVEWSDPENRLIIASGPLGGTPVNGSGTISVVTKGPMTNGATSTQACGFLGAYLRFNGYHAIVFQGASDHLVYLHLSEGKAELRDASHLAGLDTWETQDAIGAELGKNEHQLSVFSMGPAGENMVKFAVVAGDKGHVAAHNGPGAVMGAKKLKAIAVAKTGRVSVDNPTELRRAARALREDCLKDRNAQLINEWGTSFCYSSIAAQGFLPVKNYTTNIFPEHERFLGYSYRTRWQMRRTPCWSCQMKHCHHVTITDGPYAGYVGDEPEFEQWAAWGAAVGVTDPAAALVLANEVDRLGMDTSEASWVIGWVMECYEKGVFTEEQTDGLKMTWGNVEATRAMLNRIARRQGFGNLLAEGVMRASRWIGGEASNFAIYTEKGTSPRSHDHRVSWFEMLDTATSNTGTIESGRIVRGEEFGLKETDPFSAEEVPTLVVKTKGRMVFEDCVGVCQFNMRSQLRFVTDALNMATGWDTDAEEAMEIGRRIVNLLRAFNVRHGITPDLEVPSVRYSSVPVDGPGRGRDVAPEWEKMMNSYYQLMGWDRKTGKPLPETLRRHGLEEVIKDLW